MNSPGELSRRAIGRSRGPVPVPSSLPGRVAALLGSECGGAIEASSGEVIGSSCESTPAKASDELRFLLDVSSPPAAASDAPSPTLPPGDWRRLLAGGGAREVLARIVPGDPLGIRRRVATRLRAEALLLDGDHLHV